MTERQQIFARVALKYLYNISRLVSVLLEDQHGRSVSVNVKPFLQFGRLRKALVHITKLQVVLISKRC